MPYRDALNDAAIVRAYSILESYIADRGDAIFRRELPVAVSPPPLVAMVHRQVLFWARQGINNLGQLWSDGLGLNIRTFPDWSVLDDYRNLQNLLVHQLGEIRADTELRPWMRKRLTAAGLRPIGYVGRVPIDDSDFDRFIEEVKSCVRWIESNRP